MTYEHPWYAEQLRLGNITDSDVQSRQRRLRASLGQIRTDLNPSRLGDIAEQFVHMIASYKGAEVFPNRNCSGKTDFILKVGDELFEIDVKLAQWHPTGRWFCGSSTTVKPPVYLVLVEPEGDIMDWKIRWINKSRSQTPNCPPGLEDFWKKPPELKNEPTN